MQPLNCVIADDSILDRDLLELYLSKMPQVKIVASCENGMEAREAINSNEIDIVFSDIDMPLLNGFGLLKTLKKSPVFIFVTAHSEYAVESYNLDVIDFLVKPVTFERLLKSVSKAEEYINLKYNQESKQVNNTLEKDEYFFIKESNDLVKLHFEDVAYIESMGDFSKIFTVADKKHITLVSLKNLEMQLPTEVFSRTHKQYIINHNHISAISVDELVLNQKYTLPLSPTFRQMLLDKVVSKKMVTRHLGK